MTTITLPSEDWDLLAETLDKDSSSIYFEESLRRDIRSALMNIRFEDAGAELLRKMRKTRVRSEYSHKTYRGDRVLAAMEKEEIAGTLESALSDLLHAGRI